MSSQPSWWSELNQQVVSCSACSRLTTHCREIAQSKRKAFQDETYWGRPVPNFGDRRARLLIVGLAPAAHGANRTGRMFTGDRSGEWLYRALHKADLANQPESSSAHDGLQLTNCAITAVCHCAPPDNKPTRDEIANCQPWLKATIDRLAPHVFVALGQIAWQAVVDEALERGWLASPRPKFAHAAQVALGTQRTLIGSYHPSQQNTFTGRLTEHMFDQVFDLARRCLASPN